MSDHRVSGRRTWTLKSKTDSNPSPKTDGKRTQWAKATPGWAPTAWRRSS